MNSNTARQIIKQNTFLDRYSHKSKLGDKSTSIDILSLDFAALEQRVLATMSSDETVKLTANADLYAE